MITEIMLRLKIPKIKKKKLHENNNNRLMSKD